MALTDRKIKQAKPSTTHRYLTHKNGLQLSVEPAGTHFWRFHYRFDGVIQTLCVGKYPAVSIAAAEKAVIIAREHIAREINPRELAKKAREKAKKT